MILFFSNSIAPPSFPRNNLHLCLFQEITLIILRCDFVFLILCSTYTLFNLNYRWERLKIPVVGSKDHDSWVNIVAIYSITISKIIVAIFYHDQYDHCCHILSWSACSLLPYSITISMIIIAIFYHDQYYNCCHNQSRSVWSLSCVIIFHHPDDRKM